MFKNNIVRAGNQGLLINAFTGDTAIPADMDRNLYFTNATIPAWVWKGVEYNSLASYISGSGEDGSAVSANPQFINVVTPDLRVQPTSPAVGAGINLGPTIVGAIDYAGRARVQGAQIDIGAFEQ